MTHETNIPKRSAVGKKLPGTPVQPLPAGGAAGSAARPDPEGRTNDGLFNVGYMMIIN